MNAVLTHHTADIIFHLKQTKTTMKIITLLNNIMCCIILCLVNPACDFKHIYVYNVK